VLRLSSRANRALAAVIVLIAGCGTGTVATGDGDADADADGCGSCDDGVPCTIDSCVDGLCANLVDDSICGDGRCDQTQGCVECLQAGDCDDMVSCTVDTCEARECVNRPEEGLCLEALTCDPARGCIGCSGAADCDDGVACTADGCEDGACTNVADDALCPAEARHCTQAQGCVACQVDAHCSDGLACNGVEVCTGGGTCQPGTPVACDDGIDCTVDGCSEAAGGACAHTADDARCLLGERCDQAEGCVERRTFYANTASQLYLIDTEPLVPTATLIGDFFATNQMADIALTPAGVLYGISFRDFYVIDPSTAVATLVGSLGSTESLNGLTVAPDGTVYAGSNTASGGTLYRINTATGAATAVGAFGANIASSGDIVWGPYSAIYAPDPEGTTDRLVSINPASGAATAMFDLGFSQVYGLSATAGELLGLCGGGELIVIDVDAGAVTMLHDFDLVWWGAS
jgi:hypothetical protein